MENIETIRDYLKTGILTFLVIAAFVWGDVVWGQQVWSYDFGDVNFTQNSISSISVEEGSGLPLEAQVGGGTARIRTGSNSNSSVRYIDNINGISNLGTFSQLELNAAVGGSENAFSIYGFTGNKVSYLKLTFHILDKEGSYELYFGGGTSFGENSGQVGDTFTGLEFSVDQTGNLTTRRRTSSSFSSSTDIDLFSTNTTYIVEIYANNSTVGESYYRNGTQYILNSDSWALWIDNSLELNNTTSGGLIEDSVIDGFMIIAEDSPLTDGAMYIDDIVYSNSLPDIRRIDTFTNYNTDGEWRMLSLPYDATVEQLARQNLVQGIPGSFPSAGANIFTSQNGTGVAGSQDSDWTAPTGLSETIQRGQGFIWLLYDNALIPENKPLPLDLTIAQGSANTADLDVSLASGNDGWNLLGNPFSEDLLVDDIVNWSLASGSLASVVAQVYNPEINSYVVLSGAGDKVASFQGFFLENTNATGITIPASTSNGATFFKESNRRGLISLQVQSDENNTGLEFTDRALELFFSERAEHGWDLWDASKLTPLSNQYIGMAFSGDRNRNRVLKAQDSRPYNLNEPISIPAEFFSAGLVGSAEISIQKVSNVPEGWSVEIEDTFTGKRQLIDDGTPFRFDFTTTMASKEAEDGMQAPPVIQSAEISTESPRFLVHVSPGPDASLTLPTDFTLKQNYPNPFNPTTVISYDLPVNSLVNLVVYDMMGRRVATLVSENISAGSHRVQFDASSLSSGTYMYRLQAGANIQTRKLTLIK